MFGVQIPFYVTVVGVSTGFVGTLCGASFVQLYLHSYIKTPFTRNLNCTQIYMTGNTILLYFSLNFKKKHYIHLEEAITAIFAQQIIHSINFAFTAIYQVDRKTTDDFICT